MALDCEEITAEERAQRARDHIISLAVGPPFDKLTPEKLREAANEIRKRQGLPPLP
jgi:aspartate/methionine/tyrosine aminotransferase